MDDPIDLEQMVALLILVVLQEVLDPAVYTSDFLRRPLDLIGYSAFMRGVAWSCVEWMDGRYRYYPAEPGSQMTPSEMQTPLRFKDDIFIPLLAKQMASMRYTKEKFAEVQLLGCVDLDGLAFHQQLKLVAEVSEALEGAYEAQYQKFKAGKECATVAPFVSDDLAFAKIGVVPYSVGE